MKNLIILFLLLFSCKNNYINTKVNYIEHINFVDSLSIRILPVYVVHTDSGVFLHKNRREILVVGRTYKFKVSKKETSLLITNTLNLNTNEKNRRIKRRGLKK
jgi:hypothetical protein